MNKLTLLLQDKEAIAEIAKEHENDVVCTGKVKVSSLCRDVTDYLEQLDREEEQ